MSKIRRSPDAYLAAWARGEPTEFPPDAGYVYAMVNPVYPHHVKIGSSGSLRARASDPQTWDPFRAYRIIGYSDLRADVKAAEYAAHAHFAAVREGKGEWFRISHAQALAYLNTLRAAPITQPLDIDPFADTVGADPVWGD